MKDTGLQVAYEPDKETPILADIIFVHGLNGDRHDTWTKRVTDSKVKRTHDQAFNSSSSSGWRQRLRIGPRASSGSSVAKLQGSEQEASLEIFWPKDLLPQAIPDCRIASWGYNVDLRATPGSTSTATVFDHARTLLSDLADVRVTEDERKRPIVFVAHSLGGIVVKDALNKSHAERTYLRDIFPATYGICFLGTPHRGSPKAALGETLSRLTTLWGNTPNYQILQALSLNAETLDRVHTGFKQCLLDHKIEVRTFYEEQDYKGFRIVDRFSSTIDLPDEVPAGIPADHVNMTKFESSTNQGFIRVRSALQRWTGDLQQHQHYHDMAMIRKEILSSLENNQRILRKQQIERPYKQTFSWLLDAGVGFSDWLQGQAPTRSPIFWISGKPGSGKSTLMRYAIESNEVYRYLQGSTTASWVLIPFFFSDRGAEIQKTVEGLLQELLYQILSRVEDLIDVVAHLYIQALKEAIPSQEPVPRRFIDDMQWSRSAIYDASVVFRAAKSHPIEYRALWTHANIDKALHMLIRQYRFPLRLCLFIDALDEHHGDHKKLLDTIKALAQDRAGSVQIKLCLASRPEPIFRAALSQYPGFAIQQYTRQDIKIYVHGRIESNLAAYAGSYSLRELGILTDEITNKASGVFLWVRLVVEELIEGIIDGSNIVQLRQILAQIPKELQDLYRRVLQARKGHYARESYVMFQIVMHVYEPLSLRNLIAATDVVLFGSWKRQWEEDSPDSMRRRLESRCGGLLELLDTWLGDGDEKVHLIHQTFKEFMKLPQNAVSMFRSPANSPQGNGSLFMLRFCIHLLMQKSAGESGDFRNLTSHLFTYAASSGAPASAEVSSLLQTMLQQTSFRGPRLSRNDDTVNEWYRVYELNCDVLALWETGYRWALWAFPHAHETPLMAQTIDFSKIPNVEHRDYDLLLLAASSGCLTYAAKKVADGIPVEISGRRPLLSATLQGFVALNLRGIYYETKFLIDLLDAILTKGPQVDISDFVSSLLEPYENGTLPVSEGLIECLVWLLDHRAMKPQYDSEKWRRNCYRIWEVLERYPCSPPENLGEHAKRSAMNEHQQVIDKVGENEDKIRQYPGGELSSIEESFKAIESKKLHGEESVNGSGAESAEEPTEESRENFEEKSDEEGESRESESECESGSESEREDEDEDDADRDGRENNASFKSVTRYISQGTWYPSDGMWLLPIQR